MQSGLAFFNEEDGSLDYFCGPEKDLINNRFNDAKCDSKGRLWAGTMDCDVKRPIQELFIALQAP